jgi:hypothetical protein
MNGVELDRTMKHLLSNTNTSFLGVFSSDTIPSFNSVSKFPCCFITNIDPAHLKGSHWVAFYYKSKHSLEFFDSYGHSPSYYKLANIPSGLQYNVHSLQSYYSSVCGHYCVFYLYYRSHAKSLLQIIKEIEYQGKNKPPLMDKFVKSTVHSLAHRSPTKNPSIPNKSQCCTSLSCSC